MFSDYWNNHRWNNFESNHYWFFEWSWNYCLKYFKKKVEMTKTAFTNYEKVLIELRSALRGDEFNKYEFIDKMKIMDSMIMDQTPLADKFAKRYNRKFEKII